MFTGLVEDLGTVVRADRRGDAVELMVRPDAMPVAELALGDSVCHDGCCLTVTATDGTSYAVLAGAETLARTTVGDLRPGARVNLERAMRLGDRLGGHLVAGHVDGLGTITARRDLGANIVYTVAAAPALLRYVVEKGSIALDGISLTVNRVDAAGFDVAIIPHTAAKTTLGAKPAGRRVNLEVDVIGKYVEKLLGGHLPAGAASTIDPERPLRGLP
ncbi:MAG: riboflavin synthase [Kofleriaceae bacterium]|nr:riboflavin synthase [Myxococcales bacterium]MCB9564078.1 riboflavin synthase [Kofleriaceae bacterium]MCB9572553.1 riboflavin synthase [Kofleriaceae bacterium]